MSDRRRKFRASQVPQALFCHGSTQLIPRIKDRRGGQAAILGDWCHFTAATTLVTEHGAVPPEGGLVAPRMPASFRPSGFGKWMADYFVQTVLNYADADMALLVEQEFEYAFERFDLTGHIDAFAINAAGTEAVLGDLKSGSEIVDEAEQNAQILTYIVLLVLAYPTLRKITGFICQPQNDPEEGFERVTAVTIEGDHLLGMVRYIERELNHAIDHENELNSDGWKACRYCPVGASGQCPALNGDLEEMKLTMTPEMLEAVQAEPSTEQLAALEIQRKKFTPIFTAAHDAFRERVQTVGRVVVDGVAYWVEESPGRTKITDNAKVSEALSDLPDALYHTTYAFKKDETTRALAEHASATTGAKVPIKSKVAGKKSGESLFRELVGPFTESTPVMKLKSAEVAS